MPRDLTAPFIAALAGGSLRPVFFCEIETNVSPAAPVRVWTGLGTFVWDAKSWLGVGDLGKISDIPDSTEVAAQGITLSLTGIPVAEVSLAFDELTQGLAVTLWMGLMSADTTVIADPAESFSGRTDEVTLEESGQTATLSIKVENELIDLQRPRESRYTDEDQKSRYPSDTGFRFVPGLQELNLSAIPGGPRIPLTGGGGSGSGDGSDGMERVG